MTRLDEIEARARKAALMIDIGPTSEKEWAACAAACNDVPDMAAALRAVLALHTPVDRGRATACCTCEQWIESTDPEACIEWPCPTVEAIRQLADTEDD